MNDYRIGDMVSGTFTGQIYSIVRKGVWDEAKEEIFYALTIITSQGNKIHTKVSEEMINDCRRLSKTK